MYICPASSGHYREGNVWERALPLSGTEHLRVKMNTRTSDRTVSPFDCTSMDNLLVLTVYSTVQFHSKKTFQTVPSRWFPLPFQDPGGYTDN